MTGQSGPSFVAVGLHLCNGPRHHAPSDTPAALQTASGTPAGTPSRATIQRRWLRCRSG